VAQTVYVMLCYGLSGLARGRYCQREERTMRPLATNNVATYAVAIAVLICYAGPFDRTPTCVKHGQKQALFKKLLD